MRRLVVIAAVVIGLGVVGTADSGTPNLDKIVLRAGQVGPGYKLVTRPDSRCVKGCVTLDLCGATFPNEALRTARLQVNYTRPGKTELSNKVVTYRPGGAKQALREVTRVAAHCPRGPVGTPVQGLKVTYRLERISDPRLLPGYLAVRVHVTGTVNGVTHHVTAVGVYQIDGNTFSGVYTNGFGTITEQQRLALHAAEQSVANLKAAA